MLTYKKIANRLCQVIFVSDSFIIEKSVSRFLYAHLVIGRSTFYPLLTCGKVIPRPFEVSPLNPARRSGVLGSAVQLSQRGLGRSPSWNWF